MTSRGTAQVEKGCSKDLTENIHFPAVGINLLCIIRCNMNPSTFVTHFKRKGYHRINQSLALRAGLPNIEALLYKHVLRFAY